MTFLLFVFVPVAIVSPFALRRWSEVRAGRRRAWTTSQRLFVLANAAVNTLPYMPIWPGSTVPDGFLRGWFELVALMSIPFWSLEVLLWTMSSERPAIRRCAAASGAAYAAQAAVWSGAQVEFIAAFFVIRAVSGVLLWRLAYEPE